MKNQVDAIRQVSDNDGVAHFLNSSLNKGEISRVKNDVINGLTKLLYVAPESLTKQENINFLTNITTVYIDGSEIHSTDAYPLSDLQNNYIQLRSGFDCCSAPVEVCWKDLVVYEGTP